MNKNIRKTGYYYISYYDMGDNKTKEEIAISYEDALNLAKQRIHDKEYDSFRVDLAMYNSKDKNYKWEYKENDTNCL